MKNKPKILVIFPKYDPQDSSHYPYWYKIFEKAQSDLDLKILFESGQVQHSHYTFQYMIQSVTRKPWNLLQRLGYILWYRFQGYSQIYVHYSVWSVFLSKMVTLFFGGKVFLWDCEYYDSLSLNKLRVQSIKLTDILVTGHEKIANQYRKVFGLKNKTIQVVPSWVECEKKTNISDPFQFPLDKNHKNILFVHHLSPRKGSQKLAEIIKRVIALLPKENLHFHIVGEGPDFDLLKNKQLANISQVTFYGNQPQNIVLEFFQQADFFLMPSRAEGFPRVILESQAYGVPYVATEVGCVKEITPKEFGDWIVPIGNVELFSQKMVELLVEKEILDRKKIKVVLQKNALNFNLEKSTKKFVELFI